MSKTNNEAKVNNLKHMMFNAIADAGWTFHNEYHDDITREEVEEAFKFALDMFFDNYNEYQD